MVRQILLSILLAIAAFSLPSCAAVQPWQKGDLADPIMIFDENPIDVGIQEHYLDYREGSVGGTGAQSGGCGCG